MIHIVGLGTGAFGQLTVETLKLLENSTKNFFRTAVHPVVKDLKTQGILFESFDQLYEEKDHFEEVYQAITATLCAYGKEKDLVYAVPGNPVFAETSVQLLTEACEKQNISYKIYPGISFVDTSFVAINQDPATGFKLIDAFEIKDKKPDPDVGNLITQVYNRFMASDVKLELLNYYDSDFQVYLIINAGIPKEEKIFKIPLCEIDRTDEINHLTSLYIPADVDNQRNFNALLKVMETLRSENGCPWDKKQTHQSLVSDMLEELYELIDAIEQNDYDNMVEELGDVLLHIVFQTQIAKEEGYFNIYDVCEGITEKMVNRHPHVFDQYTEISSEDVLDHWNKIKKVEKNTKTVYDEMLRIPKAYTALMESEKIQKKAAKVGFDWERPEEALEKVYEEADEVKEALLEKDETHLEEELGDLIFATVNVIRLCHKSPELILRKADEKFMNRFKHVERMVMERGKKMENCTLKELDEVWNTVKTLKL